MRECGSARVQECKSARVQECETVRVRECESERATFEHRHENKSCSACRDRLNERVKVVKQKVVKVVKVFQNITGSQLLSDIQTFFSHDLALG